MLNDVQSTRIDSTGSAYGQRTRICGLHVLHNSTAAGRLTVRDGSGSGAIVLDLDFDAAADTDCIPIPQNGILCQNGIHVSVLTNIDAVTFFHQ